MMMLDLVNECPHVKAKVLPPLGLLKYSVVERPSFAPSYLEGGNPRNLPVEVTENTGRCLKHPPQI